MPYLTAPVPDYPCMQLAPPVPTAPHEKIPSVVKLLGKRRWIPIGARLEGPKLEPEGLKLEPEGLRA